MPIATFGRQQAGSRGTTPPTAAAGGSTAPPLPEHTSYALAARFSPSQPGLIELYFNVESCSDAISTDPALGGADRSGLGRAEETSMETDSFKRLFLRDIGSTIDVALPAPSPPACAMLRRNRRISYLVIAFYFPSRP